LNLKSIFEFPDEFLKYFGVSDEIFAIRWFLVKATIVLSLSAKRKPISFKLGLEAGRASIHNKKQSDLAEYLL
jgi:hypothetical protein